MTALHLAPAVVAFVLLGAHFLRSQSYAAVAICVALIVLVFVRRRWAARAIQVGLVLGAIEWSVSAFVLVQARIAMGEAFVRLAAILGGVALFTLFAALMLQRHRARVYFGFDAGAGAGSSDRRDSR